MKEVTDRDIEIAIHIGNITTGVALIGIFSALVFSPGEKGDQAFCGKEGCLAQIGQELETISGKMKFNLKDQLSP